MSTTINGVVRYKSLAEQLLTSFVPVDDKGAGRQGYIPVVLDFAANTSVEAKSVAAPCTGKVVAAYVTAAVTSDATKTYTYKVENESNTSADVVASTLFDADPVLTANVAQALTVVAASAAVTLGDRLDVEFTGGTGSGATSVVLFFVANS